MSNQIEKYKGKNNFLSDLDNLMNNEEFRNFIKKYGRNWMEFETSAMYIQLYEAVEKEYLSKYGEMISRETMVNILKEMMSHQESRKIIVKSFQDYKGSNKMGQSLIDYCVAYTHPRINPPKIE